MTRPHFIVTLIFLFHLLLAFPQGGFKKNYYLQGSLLSSCTNAIEAPNGNLIMIGVTVDSINNFTFNRQTVVGTDAQGNFLWRKDYGNQKFEYLTNMLVPSGSVIKDGSGFYNVMAVNDSLGNNLSALIKFNYNGDTLWQKKFYSEENNVNIYFQNLTKTVDGGLLITGILDHFTTNLTVILLLKTDPNGNELWRKKLISPNLYNPVWSANRAVQDSVSKRIMVVGYQYLGGNTCPLILCTDSLGNKLFSMTYGTFGGLFAEVIQTRDKNFVTVGAKYAGVTIGSYDQSRGSIVKFDTNGTLLWTRQIDTLAIINGNNSIEELPNGDLLIAGGRDTSYAANLGIRIQMRLIRTDANGNLKWKKYYSSSTGNNTNQGPTSLNLTANGSFLISSDFYESSLLRPYRLIRIDSSGCDTTETYCKSLEQSINSPLQVVAGWQLSVYPNPAKELLHIKAEAPLNASLVLKITDVAGREMEALQFNSNNDLEVNTSNYAAGLYLLQFIYNDKTVETRRLVVVH